MSLDSDRESTQQEREGSKNPLYLESKTDQESRYVYFYLLEIDEERSSLEHIHFKTKTYFLTLPRKVRMDQNRVYGLVASADLDLISPVGWKVADLRWRKKAHLVFVLRDGRYKLEPCNAVTFEEVRTNDNYSFRDGNDIDALGDISGLYCINVRKDGQNGELGSKSDDYKISYNLQGVRRSNHHDVGQNTGP